MACAAVIFILAVIIVCVIIVQKKPISQFKKYLKENEFSSSGDTYSRQSKTEDEDAIGTYTETYNFKEHTLIATFVQYDRTDETTVEMEYIYNYAEDTVTVNQYDTAKAKADGKPDAVYLLNREEMFECVYGDESTAKTELYSTMLEFKKVMEKHLEEAGVSLQDIMR